MSSLPTAAILWFCGDAAHKSIASMWIRLEGTLHSSLLIIQCKLLCLFEPLFLLLSSLYYLLDCHFFGDRNYRILILCSTFCTRMMLSLKSFDRQWYVENTKRKWNSNVKYWSLHFFPYFWSKTEDIVSPTLASHQSQVKGCCCSCESETRPHKQPLSKQPCSQSAFVPGIAHWCRTQALASKDPSCHCSPWTAGHKVSTLASRCCTV